MDHDPEEIEIALVDGLFKQAETSVGPAESVVGAGLLTRALATITFGGPWGCTLRLGSAATGLRPCSGPAAGSAG